jgi:preprotein translocase subunit SecD
MTIPVSARRRLISALLAVACCGAGGACKKGGNSAGSLLELRPVLASNPPPCPKKAPKKDEIVLPKKTDDKDECLELGQPIVDGKDVRSATIGETPAKEPALSIVLGGIGSANLDGYAQRNQGKRLAIVADGTLVSAPVLQFSSFAGRVQVTGLSKEKTDDLFNRLKKIIKPAG